MDQGLKKFNIDQAMSEAARCLLCEDAPCQKGCPSRVPVKEFIRNIRFRNFRGAYDLIKINNIFGGVCARVCNSDSTCKKMCTSEKLLSPINIDKLQQFVCDMFIDEKPHIEIKPKVNKRVAVIGAGPSGLSAAFELHRNGLDVTVYEKESFLGGVLFSGIPEYRLPNNVVEKETGWLKDLGIEFKTDSEMLDWDFLDKSFDASILAVGLTKSVLPEIKGNNLASVYMAKEVLRAHKLQQNISLGKKVVVVGGGNSAFDAAWACHELGAKNITILYRRTESEMPAWVKEISKAKELGITIRTLTRPVEILGDTAVKALKCELMEISDEKDLDGRRKVVEIKNSVFEIAADSVVFGVGEVISQEYFDKINLKLNSPSHQTNIDKLFCTGDIIQDEKTVVHSVANGRACAKEVLGFLGLEFSEIKETHSYRKENVDLKTSFCGVTFENPFVLAAAPPTDDLDMVREAFKMGWAGAVLKTTSVETNSVPLKYPMMSGIKFHDKNLMGLGNIDLISEHHIDEVEKRVRILKNEFPEKIVIASIMGEKKEDWESLVKRLESAGVDMIECSFSCPQGTLGSKPGFMLGQDPKLVKTVASWIKSAAKKVPVVIKITPQVTDIVDIARAVKESGADGICASNSIPSLMGINPDTFVPYPDVGGKSTYSGFTGAAIKPITLRTISEIKRNVDIPITGTGGPVSFFDAVELMAVGASNVQFCTSVMHYGFDIIRDLKSGLANFMLDKNIKSVSEIIGASLPFITTHDKLLQEKKIVSNIDQYKCIKCGDCFIACRDGGHGAIVFDVETRELKTDEDKCVGCSFCPTVCPVENCLTMKEI